MRGAQNRIRQSRRGDTPAFVLHGGTRGRRPQRDGEGGTSFASERSGTAGGTIEYVTGLNGAEGAEILAVIYDSGRLAESFRVRGAKRDSSEAGPGAPGHEERRKVGTK